MACISLADIDIVVDEEVDVSEQFMLCKRSYQGNDYYVPEGKRSFKGTQFRLVDGKIQIEA